MCSITSDEFTYWMEMAKLEPFGSQVEDLRVGTLAALTANLHRDTKKKREPFVPADFTPWSDPRNDEARDEPILLKDKKAQSNMIRAALFGIGAR